MIVFFKSTNPKMQLVGAEFYWSKEQSKRFLASDHPVVDAMYGPGYGKLGERSLTSDWWRAIRNEYSFVDAIYCDGIIQIMFPRRGKTGLLFQTDEHVTEFLLRRSGK